ncbi:unnamed protein product [Calypogeia fissa]
MAPARIPEPGMGDGGQQQESAAAVSHAGGSSGGPSPTTEERRDTPMGEQMTGSIDESRRPEVPPSSPRVSAPTETPQSPNKPTRLPVAPGADTSGP